MKKILIILILTISLFFGMSIVKADANPPLYFEPDDVDNNTYIIGTMMFEEYVVLTTQKIMLAATTIGNPSLKNMTIYYKTPRGNWIDGLTGKPIVFEPWHEFYISEIFEDTLPEPFAIEDDSLRFDNYVAHSFEFYVDTSYKVDGVEVTYSDPNIPDIDDEYLDDNAILKIENINIVKTKDSCNSYCEYDSCFTSSYTLMYIVIENFFQRVNVRFRFYREVNGEYIYSNFYSAPILLNDTLLNAEAEVTNIEKLTSEITKDGKKDKFKLSLAGLDNAEFLDLYICDNLHDLDSCKIETYAFDGGVDDGIIIYQTPETLKYYYILPGAYVDENQRERYYGTLSDYIEINSRSEYLSINSISIVDGQVDVSKFYRIVFDNDEIDLSSESIVLYKRISEYNYDLIEYFDPLFDSDSGKYYITVELEDGIDHTNYALRLYANWNDYSSGYTDFDFIGTPVN